MVDPTTLKIALAGFLHDIGKFAERGDFNASPEFLDSNAQLYQPYIKEHFTHKHAVYTAAFIDYIEKWLPRELNKAEWGLGDTFANLAAGHHKPETPLQWIVAMADRIASGFERDQFEQYNQSQDFRDYKKTRLYTIFERIRIGKQSNSPDFANQGAPGYRYGLGQFDPESFFPGLKQEAIPKEDEEAEKEYKNLLERFLFEMERLAHKNKVMLWVEHFDSLYMRFASFIPGATAGNVIPDVSLYDHCRVTAAFSASLYLYHRDTQSLSVEAINESSNHKFLVITGDFYGIQKFIFQEGGSTNQDAAKILRGRSFMVSLLSELAARLLCDELDLPFFAILLNAAGKFTVLAPNLESVKQRISHVERRINDWFLKHYYGEVSVGISSIEASPADFVQKEDKGFWKLQKRLAEKLERKKYNRINIEHDGGVCERYLDSFRNDLQRPICPFCGKRPSTKETEGDANVPAGSIACGICRDQMFIGKNLVKSTRLAVANKEAEIYGDKLLVPLLGHYQIRFDPEGKLTSLAASGALIHYWDYGILEPRKPVFDVTKKFISGYAPFYTDADNQDSRIMEGNLSQTKKKELIAQIQDGGIKSFHHLSTKALEVNEKKPNAFRGIRALGVLKADVDNLGSIFLYGIPDQYKNFSRLSSLSRQLDAFFSVFIPFTLKSEEDFKDIYTVFAGGDDLFLIGPWNRLLDFALFLRKKFSEYVQNPQITFSAGFILIKPGESIRSTADRAEEALERAKDGGRNRLTVFNETLTWDEFEELYSKVFPYLEEEFSKGILNNAFLFRLNTLLEWVRQSKEIERSGIQFTLKEMDCLAWRPKLYYTTARNLGKDLDKDTRAVAVLNTVGKMGEWLSTYDARFKVALWPLIYNYR